MRQWSPFRLGQHCILRSRVMLHHQCRVKGSTVTLPPGAWRKPGYFWSAIGFVGVCATSARLWLQRPRGKVQLEIVDPSTNTHRTVTLQEFRSLYHRQLRSASDRKGGFLTAPVGDVHTDAVNSPKFLAATASVQGWRSAMEDGHCSNAAFDPKTGAGLFCVFDGHAGGQCSKTLGERFCSIFRKRWLALGSMAGFSRPDEARITKCFNAAFADTDAMLRKTLTDHSGSTAVCVLVTDKMIACGNVGDSRAVLNRGGEAVDLTCDHKPQVPAEWSRICNAGGVVTHNRVCGMLAMSRALGDFWYKGNSKLRQDEQLVISTPEVRFIERTPKDKFLVIACDGIFDVISNKDLIPLIEKTMGQLVVSTNDATGLKEVCKEMCQHCLIDLHSTDNMTITIVMLK